MNLITSFALLYTSVVKLITIQVWHSYLQMYLDLQTMVNAIYLGETRFITIGFATVFITGIHTTKVFYWVHFSIYFLKISNYCIFSLFYNDDCKPRFSFSDSEPYFSRGLEPYFSSLRRVSPYQSNRIHWPETKHFLR